MRNKAFRYLWVGQSCANLGDVLYIVALIAVVYQLTGSAVQMALVPFIITFAKFLSSIIAPIVLDRYTLKNLLAGTQGLKTILLFCLFFLIFMHYDGLLSIFILAALIAFLDGWALPAANVLVPFIVRREDLLKSNGFLSTLDQAIQFAGWTAGGMMTAIIQPEGTMLVTGVCYIISTFFMMTIPVIMNDQKSAHRETVTGYFEKVTEGFYELWRNKPLRFTQMVYLLESAAGVVWIAAILYIYVEKQLHTSVEWWGFINGAFCTGLIFASLALIKIHSLIAGRQVRIFWVSSFVTALVTAVFGLTHNSIFALILSLLFGFFDQVKGIILHTFIQAEASLDKLPNVFAAQGAITTLVFGLASLGAGWLLQHAGIEWVFILSSCLLFISILPVFLAGMHAGAQGNKRL
ncbi:MFS transporter [Heyndrickxia acidicola]|uniref:MFS transporter n=1 Tax=Heyndrickxia acidicola TaxID=209389 RepID=A0ABU6MCG1_9BACI|nr:MFS transporter [Heyndrickxia acidicola]MED1202358.1 MFS transporter [Heyndrickxia acidicola]